MTGRRGGTTHNTNKEYRWHSFALTHRNILPFSPINKRAIDLTSLFVMISRAVNAIKKWPCFVTLCFVVVEWWRHQMETFSALLALCAGNSPHKGQWRGTLMFSFICVWMNGWVNNRAAGDLKCYRAHYDVIAMCLIKSCGCMWYIYPYLSGLLHWQRVRHSYGCLL